MRDLSKIIFYLSTPGRLYVGVHPPVIQEPSKLAAVRWHRRSSTAFSSFPFSAPLGKCCYSSDCPHLEEPSRLKSCSGESQLGEESKPKPLQDKLCSPLVEGPLAHVGRPACYPAAAVLWPSCQHPTKSWGSVWRLKLASARFRMNQIEKVLARRSPREVLEVGARQFLNSNHKLDTCVVDITKRSILRNPI